MIVTSDALEAAQLNFDTLQTEGVTPAKAAEAILVVMMHPGVAVKSTGDQITHKHTHIAVKGDLGICRGCGLVFTNPLSSGKYTNRHSHL